MAVDASPAAVLEQLTRARISLLLQQPFWGTLATRLILKDATDDEWCPTAATDGRNFYYNRNFISKLNKQETIFLVAHEVEHCFPPGTIIPGEYKAIEEYTEGDRVVGNGGVHSKTVIPMERQYNGNLVEVKARGMLPLKMTTEHPVLVRTFAWKTTAINGKTTTVRDWSEPEWVTAENLKEGMWVHVPKLTGDISSPVMQFEFGNSWSSSKELYNGVQIDNDVAYLLGWYVAEGSTSTWEKDNKVNYSSVVTLHINETDIAENIQKILKNKFGINSSISTEENTCRVHFASNPLGKWLMQHCGKGSKNKRIPADILYNTDVDILKTFLKSYIDGDGHYNTGVNFTTVSKTLAYQVQMAFTRLGAFFHVHSYDPTTGSKYNENRIKGGVQYKGGSGNPAILEMFGVSHTKVRSTKYYGEVDDAYLVPITAVSLEHYEGPVYNMETSCHTYAAGNIMTHNCVYDHMDRRGSRHPKRWNAAADYVINYELHEHNIGKLPDPKTSGVQACFDAKYKGMFAEEVYEALSKDPNQQYPEFDIHLEPGDGKGDEMSEEERRTLGDEIRNAVMQAAKSAGAGGTPAGVRRMLKDLTDPQMDWREILNMKLQSMVKADFTWDRCSRKMQAAGIFLPATKNDFKVKAAVSIDCSGSMADEMLRDLLTETKGIMQQFMDFELDVWCFDTKVYGHEKFTPDNLDDIDTYEIKGGGGTSFECNWTFMKEKGIEPERFIMMTDGYPNGGWGDENYCDTLFLIHGDTARRIVAPFGMTAWYEKDSHSPSKK